MKCAAPDNAMQTSHSEVAELESGHFLAAVLLEDTSQDLIGVVIAIQYLQASTIKTK